MPRTKDTSKIDAARKFIEKHGKMPDGRLTPSAKLARMLYSEKGHLFDSVEAARFTIRLARGKAGDKNRHYMGNKEMYVEEEMSVNPYNLPASDEASYKPYVIKGKRILGLFDVHVPYHNIAAVSCAIREGKKMKPDTILLGGDTIDFYQGSDYDKDRSKKQIIDELVIFQDFISVLRKEFPKAKIIFKEGNHEERYNRFLYKKAGELQGIPEFSLENIIRKRAGDIDYVGEKRVIKAGNLNIIHGHEFKGGISAPVNIARGLFLKAKVSCMQGHNHQTSEHTDPDMNGKITTTWSVGCLSELHPQYMPLNKWNHGFVFIEIGEKGSFKVHNKRINKGVML